MDFQSLLFDPIYAIQGVLCTLALSDANGGTVFEGLTAIDKTAGVDIGDGGGRQLGKMPVAVPTIKPAAIFRMKELIDRGVPVAKLYGATLDINGFTWSIHNTKPKPTLNGELDGELMCILIDKTFNDSESESESESE